MDKRYEFPAVCPNCKSESIWLFSANEMGLKFVDCEHCGVPYAIEIGLDSYTIAIYKLELQK